MAAADLDGDGTHRGRRHDDEHLADAARRCSCSTPPGELYRPSGRAGDGVAAVQPLRPGNDADFNGVGNHGYGAYGENVGIGNLDDDPQLEIVVTFDNHQINVFNHDGTSVLASPWFTQPRERLHAGARLGWGQFIRWLSPRVEAHHYHRHAGPWPDVRTDAVAAVDGLAAVGRRPRRRRAKRGDRAAERGDEGALRDAGATRSWCSTARRAAARARPAGTAASRRLPLSRKPAVRPDGDWYPPSGIPAPTVVDIAGDRRPEIVAAGARRLRLRRRPDGQAPLALRLRPRTRRRRSPRRSSPPTSTATARPSSSSAPTRSHRRRGPARRALRRGQAALRHPPAATRARDGNGIGVPAAPSIADLDGDGRLEIVLSTFDHGIDVYRVPGSGTNCLPWPTGRGNLLRNGAAPATAP